jgi:hypothetical protein
MSRPEDYEGHSGNPESPPSLSLPSRLFNIYAAPGEVFDDVKRSPFRVSNWVAPALLLILVSWTCPWLVFRQPAIEQQLREVTAQAIDEQVATGKIQEDQAEQVKVMAERWSVLGAKIGAYAVPPFAGFGMPFLLGVVVWLIGTKMFGAQFGYMKAVEVSALAGMIGVLHTIVQSLLILLTGNLFASLSPVLLIRDYNPQVFWHAAAASLNIMTFWALGVRSIALAKLSGSTTARASAWMFGLWIIYTVVTVGGGFAVQALVNR